MSPLAAPDPNKQIANVEFTLIANSAQAEKGWFQLSEDYPEAAQRCYEHLVTDPFRRIPRRVYPMQGKQFKGVWEYEVTGAERVFYRPDADNKAVLIIKAGGHKGP